MKNLFRTYLTIIDIAQNGRFPWFWIYAFTAFIMAVAVTVFAWLASESRKEAGEGRTANAPPARAWKIPAERIKLLARFEPPSYEPAGGESPQFVRAMQPYVRKDYAGAIPGLRAMLDAQPDSVETRFYLAICQLLTKDRDSAISELKNVIAAGSTKYLEPARFYLAKALLGNDDVRGADVQLRIVAEMHGGFGKQARELLAQITPAS